MKLTNEELKYDLTHKYAGNGWAIVEMLGDNFCRVVSIPITKKEQAYLAWGNVLTRTQVKKDFHDKDSPMIDRLLPKDIADKLSTLREDIKNGKKEVVSSHIREVTKRQ